MHCLCRSEIPPAGAPPGFDYAAIFLCSVRTFARPRRSAQDDTVGWLLWGSSILCPSKIVADKENKCSHLRLTKTEINYISHAPNNPPCHPERRGADGRKDERNSPKPPRSRTPQGRQQAGSPNGRGGETPLSKTDEKSISRALNRLPLTLSPSTPGVR